MFDTYVTAKTENPRKWIGVTLMIAVGVHVAGAIALVIYSFWKIEKIVPRYVSVSFIEAAAIATPPPPPPPPPPPAHHNKTQTNKVVIKTADVVQPTPVVQDKPPDPPKDDEPESDDPNGQVGGVAGGVAGGTGTDPNGVVGGVGPPQPVVAPKSVSAATLNSLRINSDGQIHLPNDIKQVIAKQHQKMVVVAVKMCLSASGEPTAVDIAKSSGYGEADSYIVSEVHKWRYRPYTVNGTAVPVCTAVVFQYAFD